MKEDEEKRRKGEEKFPACRRDLASALYFFLARSIHKGRPRATLIPLPYPVALARPCVVVVSAWPLLVGCWWEGEGALPTSFPHSFTPTDRLAASEMAGEGERPLRET